MPHRQRQAPDSSETQVCRIRRFLPQEGAHLQHLQDTLILSTWLCASIQKGLHSKKWQQPGGLRSLAHAECGICGGQLSLLRAPTGR